MADLVSPDLLEILVCPDDRTKLSLADDGQVERVNALIGAGSLKNKAGKAVTEPIKAGLVREDGAILYPVRDWPCLLVDEGIPTAQL